MTYQALTTKFQDVLKETQKNQVEFKTTVKDKIGRQARIISSDVTDEQVEQLCEDPEVIIYYFNNFLNNKNAFNENREYLNF